MNCPFKIPKQILSNLLLDSLFLYKNLLEDSFMVLDYVEGEIENNYLLGFTIQFRFQDQDVLKLMVTFMVNTSHENGTFTVKFIPYDNGKLFEAVLDDDSNAVEGMSTEETEMFINENAELPIRVKQLVISKLYEKLSENVI